MVQLLATDLKPDNVLFLAPEDDKRILIGDFGLSKLLESSKLSLVTHCGTLAVRYYICIMAIKSLNHDDISFGRSSWPRKFSETVCRKLPLVLWGSHLIFIQLATAWQ